MQKNNKNIRYTIALLIGLLGSGIIYGQKKKEKSTLFTKEMISKIETLMEEGDIPGLAIGIIKGNEREVKTLGYETTDKNKTIINNTLFELGSTTKSYTALAILKLVEENKIELTENISDYLPWFNVTFEGKEVTITIQQLLHHTSGIPWETIALIPEGDEEDALKNTVSKVDGIELSTRPGTTYEYATINYDILGLLIEEVTKTSYREYIQKEILLPLELKNTYVGTNGLEDRMSVGNKISFFKARPYNAPVFRGNEPAGYIVSDIEDMTSWLQYQMGVKLGPYQQLIEKSHQRDTSVKPHGLVSYAFGWEVSLEGDNIIYHGGMNPNFSSFITFRKKDVGVVVLANANSNLTEIIGDNVLKMTVGDAIEPLGTNTSQDKSFSIIAILMSIYLLGVLAFIGYVFYEIVAKKRTFEKITWKKVKSLVFTLIAFIPFLAGIYLLPTAMANFSWESALVWTPLSFGAVAGLGVVGMGLSYLAFLFTTIFPEKNEYKRAAPKVIVLSVLSGLANMVVIVLITSSFQSNMELKYMLFYFALAAGTYLSMRKTVQSKMVYVTKDIIYDLRIKMIDKVFRTSFEKFERIDRGRVYSVMDDDIGTIGHSADIFVSITTNIITAFGAFTYMAILNLWITLITVLMLAVISSIYYVVSNRTKWLFDKARETKTVYLELLNGMIDGYKELSISKKKKANYKEDLKDSTEEFRNKSTKANIKFINAFMVGESLLIVLLGLTAFGIPEFFPNIQSGLVLSFVVILLYLIGPINGIFGAIPQLIHLQIAWKRIEKLLVDIESEAEITPTFEVKKVPSILESFSAESIEFKYDNDFSVGPIDLEVKSGETLFIIGGNGSGKTTLSRLLTGLYTAQSGNLFINGEKVSPRELGEYYSAVFNPFYLFQKIYAEDIDLDENKINELTEVLGLQEKVNIKEGKFSTISLSGGQLKRLALLQCYLEDKPIYLFDEWAADQDPVFRKYFYRELLPKMKEQGKIIIAISHDDQYFDVADKILKLDVGKGQYVKEYEMINDVKSIHI
ncbi:cyclic peptide export ABC transporter [Tenacibaculum sp. M341]|uniref:cyclic peptide export ABC transporter n=1 Tax=Tenacibaculum sp. M341 TaxID=2530339 RepID=UPI001047A595|nr:cyclic peptide export ABC transporter [Tenacibaculum sp. M341]TCI84598.1 cyclic peptide export ABC transporter [Tenacibaculum sp. M341]